MANWTFALDIGTNSIGWALVDAASGEILWWNDYEAACGVRVFRAAFDPKSGASLRAQRGGFRRARRQLRRRKQRLRSVRRILIDAGWLPSDPDAYKAVYGRLDDRTNEPLRFYRLRRKALDEAVGLDKLACILLHLARHRGFSSNRKTAGKEDGKVGKAIKQLEKSIDELPEDKRSRTLGEHLYRIATGEVVADHPKASDGFDPRRIRGRWFRRKQVEDEFDGLWNAQTRFHSLSGEQHEQLRDRLHHAIFDQRRLKSRKHLIGFCECIPRKRRAQRSDWRAIQFAILKDVCNLYVLDKDEQRIDLTKKDRQKLYDALGTNRELSFDDMRDLLESTPRGRFNLEVAVKRTRKAKQDGTSKTSEDAGSENEDGSTSLKTRKKLRGNPIEAALVKAFGQKKWKVLATEEKYGLRRLFVEDEEERAKILSVRWELPEKEARTLAKVGVPEGYAPYSIEALEKLIATMEPSLRGDSIIDEYEAKRILGFDRSRNRSDSCQYIPKLNPRFDQALINNPVVRTAINEMRRLVNSVLRDARRIFDDPNWRPERIVLEFMRDAKMTLKRYKEHEREQRENRTQNELIDSDLKTRFQILSPTRDDRILWKLWRDQGKEAATSVYSDRPISCAEMAKQFRGEGCLHIDHILPRSKTLDDSYTNKVLCFNDENDKKDDNTPVEWLGKGSSEFQTTIQRARGMMRHGFPRSKLKRLFVPEARLAEFLKRQESDNAFIAREARRFLQALYPGNQYEKEQRVQVRPGHVTAKLRRIWGLNRILRQKAPSEEDSQESKKNRADHRHHAIDAVVLALTSNKILNALCQTYKSRTAPQPPYGDFLADVEKAILAIAVSNRIARRVRGELHAMTFYRKVNDGVFSKREPVGKVKASDLLDQRIAFAFASSMPLISSKDEVADDLNESSNENSTAKDVLKEIRLNNGTLPIRRVQRRITNDSMREIGEGESSRWVIPDRQHHFILYKPSGVAKRYDVFPIYRLDAAARAAKGKPVYDLHIPHDPEAEILMVLSSGDSLLVDFNGKNRLFRVDTCAATTGQIMLIPNHSAAGREGEKWAPKLDSFFGANPRKVAIDILGRVRVADRRQAPSNLASIDPRIWQIAREQVTGIRSNSDAQKQMRALGFSHCGAQLTAARHALRQGLGW